MLTACIICGVLGISEEAHDYVMLSAQLLLVVFDLAYDLNAI